MSLLGWSQTEQGWRRRPQPPPPRSLGCGPSIPDSPRPRMVEGRGLMASLQPAQPRSQDGRAEPAAGTGHRMCGSGGPVVATSTSLPKGEDLPPGLSAASRWRQGRAVASPTIPPLSPAQPPAEMDGAELTLSGDLPLICGMRPSVGLCSHLTSVGSSVTNGPSVLGQGITPLHAAMSSY